MMSRLKILKDKTFPEYIFSYKFDSILVFDLSLIMNPNLCFFEYLNDFLIKTNESYLYIDNVLPFSYISSTPLSNEKIYVEKFSYKYVIKGRVNGNEIRKDLQLPDGAGYFSVVSQCLISGNSSKWGVYYSVDTDLILIGLSKEIKIIFENTCMNKDVFKDYHIKKELFDQFISDPEILRIFKQNYSK